LATATGRTALRCGRGAAPTGAGDDNLRQYKLGDPWRTKEKERRAAGFVLHRRQRRHGDGEEQGRRRSVQAVLRARERVCCRCEREVRKLKPSLNRCEGREEGN
jgi:hypothetical protein